MSCSRWKRRWNRRMIPFISWKWKSFTLKKPTHSIYLTYPIVIPAIPTNTLHITIITTTTVKDTLQSTWATTTAVSNTLQLSIIKIFTWPPLIETKTSPSTTNPPLTPNRTSNTNINPIKYSWSNTKLTIPNTRILFRAISMRNMLNLLPLTPIEIWSKISLKTLTLLVVMWKTKSKESIWILMLTSRQNKHSSRPKNNQ